MTRPLIGNTIESCHPEDWVFFSYFVSSCIFSPFRRQGFLYRTVLFFAESAASSSHVLLMVQLGLGFFFVMFVFSKTYKECGSCLRRRMRRRIPGSGVGGESVHLSELLDPETGEPTVVCYLCQERVRVSLWHGEEGGHRFDCAIQNQETRGTFESIFLFN